MVPAVPAKMQKRRLFLLIKKQTEEKLFTRAILQIFKKNLNTLSKNHLRRRLFSILRTKHGRLRMRERLEMRREETILFKIQLRSVVHFVQCLAETAGGERLATGANIAHCSLRGGIARQEA
jgi:hypothetical protein